MQPNITMSTKRSSYTPRVNQSCRREAAGNTINKIKSPSGGLLTDGDKMEIKPPCILKCVMELWKKSLREKENVALELSDALYV